MRLFPLHQYDLPSSTSSSFELVESCQNSPLLQNNSHSTGDIISKSANTSNTLNTPLEIGNKPLTTFTSHLDPKIVASPLNPMVDYTPPSYITLLFTDLGVLTPSGVSDELIKFYY